MGPFCLCPRMTLDRRFAFVGLPVGQTLPRPVVALLIASCSLTGRFHVFCSVPCCSCSCSEWPVLRHALGLKLFLQDLQLVLAAL